MDPARRRRPRARRTGGELGRADRASEAHRGDADTRRRGGGRHHRRAGARCAPHRGARTRRAAAALAAAVASPAVTAWALHRVAGTALSAAALKVTAALLREVPLPVDQAAWSDGADAFDAGDIEGYVAAMAEAYGVGPTSASGGWSGRERSGVPAGASVESRPTSGVARSAGSSNLGRTPKVLSHLPRWGCGPGDRATKCSGLDPTEGVRSHSRRTGGRGADGRDRGRVRAARRPPARPPVAAARHRRLARGRPGRAIGSSCRFGDRAFALEGGGVLRDVTIAFETWGTLDDDASNAVLVCHALTGDSHAAGPLAPGHPDAGLVGHPDRSRPAHRHRPVVRRVRQRPRRLPGHDRSGEPAPRRRQAVGEPLPRGVGARLGAHARRRWPTTSGSAGGTAWSAARWAACRCSSGP